MKFSIPKEAFLAELQILQGIVEKRNTMPILANILMNVSPSDIELTGTDLEVGMRTHLGAEIEKPGAITVNGKKIFEIVKSLPEGQTVRVELKDETIDIQAGESEFKILCLAKEDYPQVPDAKFEKGIDLPLPGPQGHDRPGLLRHHPGAALLPERGAAVVEEPPDGAHQHGRAPALLHARRPRTG